MREDIRIGQIVTVEVLKFLGSGLSVDVLEYQVQGLVRKRELELTDERPDAWQERYHAGAKFRAVIVALRSDGRVELSLQLQAVERWLEAVRTLRQGQVVEGTVANVTSYGLFVELGRWVTGLVHISRFPAEENSMMLDQFWPGDRIKVVIDSVRYEERRVDLSLRGLNGRRWLHLNEEGAASSNEPVARARSVEDRDSRVHLPFDLLVEHAPCTVLVVEDDEDQRKAVTNWLRQAGQNVFAVSSGEEALALFPNVHPDLVLMDVGLPECNGIDTMQLLLAREEPFRGAIMTDWGRADEHQCELDELAARGVPLLLKPLLPIDLLDLLFEKNQDETTRRVAQPDASTPRIIRPEDVKVNSVHSREKILEILQRAQHQTGATKVVLFGLDSVQRKVEIVAQLGRENLNMGALVELALSPVRDAAENGVNVYAEDLRADDQARFKYFSPLLPFTAASALRFLSVNRCAMHSLCFTPGRTRFSCLMRQL